MTRMAGEKSRSASNWKPQRAAALVGRASGRMVEQRAPDPAARGPRVHRDLFYVQVGVDPVGDQVGGGDVFLIDRDPRVPLQEVGSQLVGCKRVVLGDLGHAYFREPASGRPFDVLEHRQVGLRRVPDAHPPIIRTCRKAFSDGGGAAQGAEGRAPRTREGAPNARERPERERAPRTREGAPNARRRPGGEKAPRRREGPGRRRRRGRARGAVGVAWRHGIRAP